MPEWVSYSSKDMVNWTCHGVALYSRDVPWSNRRAYAWASQMIPHFDKTENKMKYYLYICPQEGSRHSIGVAVADKPEGPYVVPSYGTDEEGNPIYKSLIGHYLTTDIGVLRRSHLLQSRLSGQYPRAPYYPLL